MKIAPSPESIHPNPRSPGRAGQTPGFAQLLEGGTEARSVMSHRALGFSEAGILGVHFAHEQGTSSRPTASENKDMARTDRLPATTKMAMPAMETATPNLKSNRVVLGQRSNGAPLAGPPVPNPAEPPATVFGRIAMPDISGQAAAENTPLDTVRPPAPQPARRRLPFQVRLLGDDADLVVVVEGLRCGDESILELEATARAVASEYCIAISHLFVKPNGNGTAA